MSSDTLMISSASYINLLKIKLKTLEFENQELSNRLDISKVIINKAHNKRIQTIYKEVEYRNDLLNKEHHIRELERRLRPSLLKRLLDKIKKIIKIKYKY